MNMVNALTDEQTEKLCRLRQGADTCSFLVMDGTIPGFVCAKGTPMEEAINARREAGSMAAKGNNCSGPPNFKLLD